jgi:hypothetical protein
MATPQLSPGILVREVDLTVGRADNVIDNIGAIAGPFRIGPVNEVIDITTEQELINTFGKPISTDGQYEYWMSASSFLSYGGILKVVRTDGSTLRNANSNRSGTSSSTLKIKNFDDYNSSYSNDTVTWGFAAKTPGTWTNNLKVCLIDDKADQTINTSTISIDGGAGDDIKIGYGVSVSLSNITIAGVGTTSSFTGYLKAIVTGITTSGGSLNPGIGVTDPLSIDVKILSRVSSTGTETPISYAPGNDGFCFKSGTSISILNNSGAEQNASYTIPTNGVVDWYDQQTLSLTNSTLYWKSIAPKPVSNNYSLSRNGKNDALHVVVIDDTGSVTGVQGNLLEKHLNLSKATDAVSGEDSPEKIFWKDYLALNSSYVYAGHNPSTGSNGFVSPSAFSNSFTGITTANGLWNRPAQGVTFSVIGNAGYTLTGGVDYSSANGMSSTLGDLVTSYGLFSNSDEVQVDYLIMGPGLTNKGDSQAKANYLISIAEQRKDCIATISPHRSDLLVGSATEGFGPITNSATQTDNVIQFFSPLSSSSYAIFDSGYKYTYDRFNNKFRYIPCNADIAGLMVRTGIVAYPWFSPAGQQRGVLNNAIKLAYNPNKAQRDQLYPLRVNSIVNQPGSGILLFGDKTALSYSSAFDRINVRRLFLTIEQSLQRAARAQLFEINDEITRANFKNIVEPYLRDIQAKRGLYGFLVVCDSSNNTPDVVDNNEFRADIYLKPTKSINYITLTFVATRTGVSFEEVAGRV